MTYEIVAFLSFTTFGFLGNNRAGASLFCVLSLQRLLIGVRMGALFSYLMNLFKKR